MNIFATGKVKNYQIGLSITYVAELVVVYILFRTGSSLVMGVAMKAVLNFVVIFMRLYYTHKTQSQFSLAGYVRRVIFPVFGAALLTVLASLPVIFMIQDNYTKLYITPIIIVVSLVVAYFIGLNSKERKSLKKLIVKHKHA